MTMSRSETATTARLQSETRDTSAVKEARRTMEICNACRYCEGYCPVFPAMERRRAFSLVDLDHLANLCHNCKGCWYACQYAPPHEFGLNLPKTFSQVRSESYARYAWPGGLGVLFERNGLWVFLLTALMMAAVMIGSALLISPEVMTSAHRGEGAFYAVIPHETMVLLGGTAFGWAILAMVIGAARYWRASGASGVRFAHVLQALREAATTKHLGGAGDGCNDVDERFGVGRRHMHLATMWGFLLCFGATSVGTVMHYLLGWDAPYPWFSAPVLLGTVGGVLLTIGTAGLFALKIQADREPADVGRFGMDYALLALLNFSATTGLALLFFRHTSAMGWLLAIHLGFVLALFLSLPYGKFVHGVYRTLALVRDVAEREQET
ncbi:MAG: tricarballylate utilization 4Fe-4S protein TcuB [Neomegalonema sp.]|nr:tricarballylate utilization 4Fe-4S protein TcuB [Neomegalonema sp.]